MLQYSQFPEPLANGLAYSDLDLSASTITSATSFLVLSLSLSLPPPVSLEKPKTPTKVQIQDFLYPKEKLQNQHIFWLTSCSHLLYAPPNTASTL